MRYVCDLFDGSVRVFIHGNNHSLEAPLPTKTISSTISSGSLLSEDLGDDIQNQSTTCRLPETNSDVSCYLLHVSLCFTPLNSVVVISPLSRDESIDTNPYVHLPNCPYRCLTVVQLTYMCASTEICSVMYMCARK